MSNPHWRQPVMFQDRMRASIPAFPSRVSEPSLLFICRIVVGRCRRLRSGPADVLLGSSAVSWRKERGRFFRWPPNGAKAWGWGPGDRTRRRDMHFSTRSYPLVFFFSRAKMKRWMIWVNAFIWCFALLCFALLCFALLCFALLCFAFLPFCFPHVVFKIDLQSPVQVGLIRLPAVMHHPSSNNKALSLRKIAETYSNPTFPTVWAHQQQLFSLSLFFPTKQCDPTHLTTLGRLSSGTIGHSYPSQPDSFWNKTGPWRVQQQCSGTLLCAEAKKAYRSSTKERGAYRREIRLYSTYLLTLPTYL